MTGSESATSNNRRKATKRKNALSTDTTRYRLRVLCVCACFSCMVSTKRPRKGEGGVSDEFACVIKAVRDWLRIALITVERFYVLLSFSDSDDAPSIIGD